MAVVFGSYLQGAHKLPGALRRWVGSRCLDIQKGSLCVLCAVLALSGCATTSKSDTGRVVGSAAGCGAGYAIASGQTNNPFARILSCVAGAVILGEVGARIGAVFDERDKRVKELARQNGVEIKTDTYQPKSDTGTKGSSQGTIPKKDLIYEAQINIDQQFASGSSKLTPNGRMFFEGIAKEYKDKEERLVLIVGHTDSKGGFGLNQRLSEARAYEVGQLFIGNGFHKKNIYYQGAGASEPVETNSTPEGRAMNRRVAVVDAGSIENLAIYKRGKMADGAQKWTTDAAAVRSTAKPTKPTQQPGTVTATKQDSTGTRADSKDKAQTERREPAEAAKPAQNYVISRPVPGIDFGGVLLAQDKWPDVYAKSGKANDPAETSWWRKTIDAVASVLPAAHAGPQVPSIFEDELPIAGSVKNMGGATRAIFSPDDHMPGYYRQPMYGEVGKHFANFMPVAISANGTPTECSAMSIHLNYSAAKVNAKPDHDIKGSCRVYQHRDGLLYRWKADENGQGVIGADFRLPVNDKKALGSMQYITTDGKLYYQRNGVLHVQKLGLRIKVPTDMKIKWGV